MDGLPTSPDVHVSTKTATATMTMNVLLPSLIRSKSTREHKKTTNQRVDEILLEAAAEKKKSAHFWDDTRRVKKALRCAR